MQFFTFCLTRLNKPAKRIFTFSVWMFLFAATVTYVDAQTITLTDANSASNGITQGSLIYGQKDIVLFGFKVTVKGSLKINQFNIGSTGNGNNGYFQNGRLYRSTNSTFSASDTEVGSVAFWGTNVNISGLNESFYSSTGQTYYYFLVADYTVTWGSVPGTIKFQFASNQGNAAIIQSSGSYKTYNSFNVEGNSFTISGPTLDVAGANTSVNGITTSALSYGQADIVLFGFSLTVRGTMTIGTININSSGASAGSYFSNMRLYRSNDDVFSSGDTQVGTGSIWGSVIDFANLNQSFSTTTDQTYYYFLVGDYTSNGSTPASIQFNFSNGQNNAAIIITSPQYKTYNSYNFSGQSFSFTRTTHWKGYTSSDWNTPSNWSGGFIPGASDIVYIGSQSFNIAYPPVISENVSVGQIIFGTTQAAKITVNSGYTLTVNGDITQQNSTSSSITSTLAGAGSIIVNNINIGNGTDATGFFSFQTTTLTSNIANLTVNKNVALQSTMGGFFSANNATFELPSGNATIKGTIATSNTLLNTSTFTLNTGAKTGSINLASATPFDLSSTGTNTLDFSGTSGYVNYNGSVAQTIVQGTGIIYGNKIKVNNPAGVSLNAALSIPTLTIGDETANSVFDEKGFLTGLTSLTIKNASKFADGNTSFSFPATTVLDAGTTLEFNKAGAQTITLGSVTPQNVILSGSGTKTITAASSNTAFKIGGDLTITSPATIAYSSKINAIKIGGDFNEGSALNSGTLPVNIGGDWNNTATSTVAGTVTYDGSVNQKVGGVNYTNLILSNGGTKTVNSAATVSGNVSVSDNTTLNSNGNLTLKATATTNANIGPLLNGAKVTGNVTIETFLTGGQASYRSTRILSSPINDTGLSPDKTTYAQLKSYVIITGPGGIANGFDAGGKAAPEAITLNKYNESATLKQSQFTPVAAISETCTPGTGFFLFYRGDRSNPDNKVNAPYPVPENTTVKYTGPINQGDVTVNLSYHNYEGADEQVYNGYNLVGNPYPSVIDWSNVTKVNAQDALMIIKPGGGYATYTKGITVPSTIDLHYIQPGQGFYVRATAANASITFTESCKITSKTPPKMMSTPNQKLLAGRLMSTNTHHLNSAPQWNLIRLQLKDATNTEEAVVVFNQSSNANADDEDATFFGGSTISLSTQSADDKNLTINFMPDISAVSEVKLNVGTSKTGTITLNATDLSGAGPYHTTLEDTYLKKEIDLTANSSYTFEVNRSIPATFGTNRFKIRFTAPKVSPINLASFTAEQNQSGAELQWITKSEVNTDYFEVERSVNGETPVVINKIKAAGNSMANIDYNLIDQNPANGVNYYRIKQVDKNGNVTYSDVIALNYEAQTVSSNKLIIYPNPVESICNVKLAKADNDPLLFNIYDLQGKKVKSEAIAAGSMLKFNVSDLNKNIYILEAINSRTKQLIGKTKLLKE